MDEDRPNYAWGCLTAVFWYLYYVLTLPAREAMEQARNRDWFGVVAMLFWYVPIGFLFWLMLAR